MTRQRKLQVQERVLSALRELYRCGEEAHNGYLRWITTDGLAQTLSRWGGYTRGEISSALQGLAYQGAARGEGRRVTVQDATPAQLWSVWHPEDDAARASAKAAEQAFAEASARVNALLGMEDFSTACPIDLLRAVLRALGDGGPLVGGSRLHTALASLWVASLAHEEARSAMERLGLY